MDLLQCFKSIVNIIFSGCYNLLSSIDAGGISYLSILVGFMVVSFLVCKFWKFGGSD